MGSSPRRRATSIRRQEPRSTPGRPRPGSSSSRGQNGGITMSEDKPNAGQEIIEEPRARRGLGGDRSRGRRSRALPRKQRRSSWPSTGPSWNAMISCCQCRRSCSRWRKSSRRRPRRTATVSPPSAHGEPELGDLGGRMTDLDLDEAMLLLYGWIGQRIRVLVLFNSELRAAPRHPAGWARGGMSWSVAKANFANRTLPNLVRRKKTMGARSASERMRLGTRHSSCCSMECPTSG